MKGSEGFHNRRLFRAAAALPPEYKASSPVDDFVAGVHVASPSAFKLPEWVWLLPEQDGQARTERKRELRTVHIWPAQKELKKHFKFSSLPARPGNQVRAASRERRGWEKKCAPLRARLYLSGITNLAQGGKGTA